MARIEEAVLMPQGSKWRIWLQEVRAAFFTATVVPILLGSVIAWAEGSPFQWGYFLLTLIGGIFLHAGTNVANDYFDHRSGADEQNFEYVRPYTGGSRIIQKGLLSPREVLAGAILLFLGGIFIGLFLVATRGVAIFYLGLVGVFCGFFYTAPPFRLVATGFGELLIGLNFGVLMTLGAYYVQAQRFSSEALVASLPVSFLIAGVLYINEFQDSKSDKATGKLHLVARLGRRKAARGYVALTVATYATIVLGVIANRLSPFTLLGLLTLPIAVKGARTALHYYDDYLKLTPANVAMIMTHMFTGILMTIGYLLDKLVS
jgi:1,4-dihydroxy-2-naphthoate octaprenyltransferase